MKAATLFSGIGAPEAAMPGWRWLWSAEIEPFPSAVLAARHPRSVNLGDVTAHDFAERALAVGRPDVVVFGSPCQSFSVAGKRLGLDDPRGNLALVGLEMVRRVRPRWFVFENVLGLLSSDGGRDFAIFLAAVRECGYLGCGRVLDAQYFGLAQRRQRLFFVGCLGDWRGPAEVLSLPESLQGHPAPRRETWQGVARPLAASTPGSGGYRNDADTAENLIAFMDIESYSSGNNRDVAPTMKTGDCGRISVAYGGNDTRGPIEVSTALNAHGGPHGRLDFESETFVAAYRTSGNAGAWDTGDRTDALTTATDPNSHVLAFSCKDHGADAAADLAPTLRAMPHDGSHANGGGQMAVAFSEIGGEQAVALNWQSGGDFRPGLGPIASALQREQTPAAHVGGLVRRLTVIECCRLQGFPDTYLHIERKQHRKIGEDEARYLASHGLPVWRREEHRAGRWYTSVPADGPMYRAAGNSMPVPVLRWLLTRLEAVDAALVADREEAA